MGLLRVACLVFLASCYQPTLRDCTVSCSSAGDCAQGQVCGTGGMCAAPDVSCGSSDAAPMDAATDAPESAIIHIRVMGKGSVAIKQTSCSTDCMVTVARGIAVDIVAVDGDDTFQMWTSAACSGQDATCTFTPTMDMTDVAAKFSKSGPG